MTGEIVEMNAKRMNMTKTKEEEMFSAGNSADMRSENIMKIQEKRDEMMAKYMAKKGGHH